jgi:ABC-type glycerol-3-phosphate transport system substrate-binding protein
MRELTRRNLLKVAVGTCITSALAACSSPAASTTSSAPTAAAAKSAATPAAAAPTTAPAAAAAATATPSGGVVSQTAGFKLSAPPFNSSAKSVLTFINTGTSQVESQHQNTLVDQWNKTNPDVQVDLQYVAWADLNTKTQAYLAAGTPPDCSWYCGTGDQEAFLKGWVTPLDNYLQDVKADFNPLLFAPNSPSVSPDGKNWLGVPFCMYGEGLVVRKDYLAKAGVTDLSTLETWAGWSDAVAKAASPPAIYGYQFPQDLSMLSQTAGRFFWSNGLAHFADFRPAKKEAYIQSLDFIKEMLKFSPDAAKAWNHGGEIAAWTAGNVATMGAGSYFFGDIIPTAPQIATADAMAALPFPHGPQLKRPVNSLGFCGYMMFDESKHKDETAAFLKYMSSPTANNAFPMNLTPAKTVDLDQRVSAYKVYSPSNYEQDRWWQEAWITITDPTKVDQVFASAYLPSAEIDKVFQNIFPSWTTGSTSTADAYEQLKAQISPILKNPPA